MAKFSVCRIYKVTLWRNFSYNYSVNLLQILHLYIHPTIIYGNYQSYQSFISSRNFLKRLRRSGRSHGKQALDVLSFIRCKRQINRQLRPFLLACVQPPSPPLRKKSTFPERRGWLYTTKTEEGLSQFDFPLPTSDFRRPFSALVVHRSISKTHRRKLILS